MTVTRAALITGAAGGIGLATAEAFVVAGWRVFGCDQRRPKSFPEGAGFWLADLTDLEDISKLVRNMETECGRVDALVNNAAVQVIKSILETSLQDWDKVQNGSLRAIFDLSRCTYHLLKASRGAIVNVSSVHALATSNQLPAYAASKGGLLALTRGMALEFGTDGVRVNTVLPGAVENEMLQAGLQRGLPEGESPEQRLDTLTRRTALGRAGRPSEIAQAILFLADADRSSYITGQSLVIDGGAMARLSTE